MPFSNMSIGVVSSAVMPQNQVLMPQDKLPDPPAIPAPVTWFVIGLLGLGVLFTAKIYFVVFPHRWSHKTFSEMILLRRTATGIGSMNNDEVKEGSNHGGCARSE
jgi:hypothetical protein